MKIYRWGLTLDSMGNHYPFQRQTVKSPHAGLVDRIGQASDRLGPWSCKSDKIKYLHSYVKNYDICHLPSVFVMCLEVITVLLSLRISSVSVIFMCSASIQIPVAVWMPLQELVPTVGHAARGVSFGTTLSHVFNCVHQIGPGSVRC